MEEVGLTVEDVVIWAAAVVVAMAAGFGGFFADVRRARARGLPPPGFTEWGKEGGLVGWWYRRQGRDPPGWVRWSAGPEVPAWASPGENDPSPPAPTPESGQAPREATTVAPAAAGSTATVVDPVPGKGAATTVADPSPTKGAPTTVAGPASPGDASTTVNEPSPPATVADTRVAPAPPSGDLPTWVRASLEVALGERYGEWSLLGAGGMGVVVRGVDQKLGREVAVKLPPPQLAADPRFRDRFLREAQAQARLTHSAIGRVLDVPDVPASEIPVMVLEFLAGEDLAARLERVGPEPVEVVRGRLVEAAAGLAHAHSKGVLHRDVKPSNLMLVEDHVRLLDFGLAALEGSDKLTTTGMIMGSLPYMPPEQLRGEAVAEPADQFSLAVTGFELLTGRLPFGPEDRDRSAPAELAAHRAEVPAGLASALRRGMAAAPDARYADLEAFAAALRTG